MNAIVESLNSVRSKIIQASKLAKPTKHQVFRISILFSLK